MDTEKDTERGFGIHQLKFLSLVQLINLHHKDNIYHVVLESMLMQNLIVEAYVENNEVECTTMYNTLSATESESGDRAILDGEGKSREDLEAEVYGDQLDSNFKYEMAKKDGHISMTNSVLKLKNVMMRHLYQEKYSDKELQSAGNFCDSYNPQSSGCLCLF
jgi:hypothetical protein